jgi:hypothetical protein
MNTELRLRVYRAALKAITDENSGVEELVKAAKPITPSDWQEFQAALGVLTGTVETAQRNAVQALIDATLAETPSGEQP